MTEQAFHGYLKGCFDGLTLNDEFKHTKAMAVGRMALVIRCVKKRSRQKQGQT